MVSNGYKFAEILDLDFSAPQVLLQTLQQLRQSVRAEGQEIFKQWRNTISRRSFLISGLNLAYYLALRQHDLRQMQAALMPLGLSSLGRCEALCIMATLPTEAATDYALIKELRLDDDGCNE